MKLSNELNQQLYKYIIIGSLAALTNWTTFYISTYLFNINYLISAVLAFVIASAVNYILNKKHTFKNTYSNKKKQFFVFLLVALTTLFWNEVLLYLFVEYLNIEKIIAAILATGIVFLWSFTMHKKITFGIMK